jgi:predicted secreted protein
VANVAFSLSREQRAKAETTAQSMAIERFKNKASEIAKGFGFTGYALREVSINAADQGYVPRPRIMAMEMKMASADASVPVEAGKSTVVVVASGSVQLK